MSSRIDKSKQDFYTDGLTESLNYMSFWSWFVWASTICVYSILVALRKFATNTIKREINSFSKKNHVVQ